MPNLKLLILRHAEAASEGAASDHVRPLTEYGLSTASEKGRELSGRFSIDFALVSDSTRTKQTLEAVVQSGLSVATALESPELYRVQDPRAMVQLLIKTIPSSAKSVLIVGHNPVVSVFSSILSGQVLRFAPCDHIVLSCEMDSWDAALQAAGVWTLNDQA